MFAEPSPSDQEPAPQPTALRDPSSSRPLSSAAFAEPARDPRGYFFCRCCSLGLLVCVASGKVLWLPGPPTSGQTGRITFGIWCEGQPASVQRHRPAPGTEHTVSKCPSRHSLILLSVCTWPGLPRRFWFTSFEPEKLTHSPFTQKCSGLRTKDIVILS